MLRGRVGEKLLRKGHQNVGKHMNGPARLRQVYDGWAFDAQFERGKAPGSIEISGDLLRFTADSGGVELPLRGLRVSCGGARNRLVFFRHSSLPDASVYTSDRSILTDSRFVARHELAEQLRRARGSKWRLWLVEGSAVVALAAVIVALVGLRGPLTKSAVSRIPAEWETKLGTTVYRQFSTMKNEVGTLEVRQDLEALVGPLVNAIPERRFEFEFHILEDPQVNAFALPGGPVVLNTGLLMLAETPEEVAGVIAHELSHVMRRHGLQQMVGTAGLFMIIQAVFGDMSGLLAVLARDGAFLVDLKYSRDFEREADRDAWDTMLRAGIDPRHLARFLSRMRQRQEEGADGGAFGDVQEALSILSTHPGLDERVADLEEKAASLSADISLPGIDLHYATMKRNLIQSIGSTPPEQRTGAEDAKHN